MNEALRQLLADAFEVSRDQLTADATQQTIESWDSLHHLQMVMALEQHYGMQIPSERIPEIKSVADIIQIVEARDS